MNWQKASILQTNSIRSIAMGPDSTIWVAQSGTGSSGGNTNVAGGVSHIFDSLYTSTGWGYTTGLPTRSVYGIAVSGSGNVYTSHFSQTTNASPNALIRGGGLGYKEGSASTFTSIYAGMPYNGQLYNGTSNVPYYDQFTLGVGTNNQEVWIGINRACNSGNCNEPTIGRYSMSGTYLSSFTSSNTPFPFNNTTTTPAPRAIFFDSQGRAWVGLSFGGGVYVYDQGQWSVINESNSLLPAGAAVNFHAITENADGDVFIGTDLGLLTVANGDYTDPNNFTLYTVSNGLPSSNILSIAAGADAIWLATGAGVVKMETPPSAVISGTVYNSSLNFNSGNLQHVNFQGCKAVLFENGLKIDSLNTDALGFFKFDSLDVSASYDVKVSFSGAINIRCNIQDAQLNQQYTVRLPYDLQGQLLNELDKLSTQTFKQEWFTDFVNWDPLEVEAYDTSGYSQLAVDWTEFNLSDNAQINDGMARMLIISKGIDQIGNHGAAMIGMTTSGLIDVGKIIFSNSKIFKDLQNRIVSIGSGIPYVSQLSILINRVNNAIFRACKYNLAYALKTIPDDDLRSKVSAEVYRTFDALYAKPFGATGNTLAPQVTSVVETILKNYMVIPAYQIAYVPSTQPAIDNTIPNLRSFNFSQPIGAVVSQTLSGPTSKLANADLMFRLDSTSMKVTQQVSEIADNAETFLDVAIVLAGFSVVGAPMVPALKSLSTAAKTLSYAFKAFSLGFGVKGIYSAYNSSFSLASTAMLRNGNGPFEYTPPVSGNLAALDNYMDKLNEIRAHVLNGEKSLVADKLNELATLEDIANNEITQLAEIVFSYSRGPLANDSLWNHFINFRFIETNAVDLSKKEALNFDFIAYLLDADGTYGDSSLLSTIDGVLAQSTSLNQMSDSLTSVAQNWTLPDGIALSANYPFQSTQNQTLPFSITVKNRSAIPAEEVYVKLVSTGGLDFQTDSVVVGTMAPGAVVTIPVGCIAPQVDTLSTFTVIAYSSTVPGDGSGGAINVLGQTPLGIFETSKHQSDFTVFPNPGNGQINFQFSAGNYQLDLYNAIGQSVYSAQLQGTSHHINAEGLAKGIYTARIHNETEAYSQRIVLQ